MTTPCQPDTLNPNNMCDQIHRFIECDYHLNFTALGNMSCTTLIGVSQRTKCIENKYLFIQHNVSHHYGMYICRFTTVFQQTDSKNVVTPSYVDCTSGITIRNKHMSRAQHKPLRQQALASRPRLSRTSHAK